LERSTALSLRDATAARTYAGRVAGAGLIELGGELARGRFVETQRASGGWVLHASVASSAKSIASWK
jgi:hypothetical protein